MPIYIESDFVKPIISSFLLAAALAAPGLAHPASLWDTLDEYGYAKLEQKQAIGYLLQQSGISDADQFLQSKTNTPEELFSNIIKFVEVTQNRFTIRTGAQERWEVEATEWMKQAAEQQKILAALKTLGLTNAVPPNFEERDAVCIFGSTNTSMRLRLRYAAELYNSGKLSAKMLVLLAGERYVTFDKHGISIDGSEAELSALAAKINKDILSLTETDLIRASYEQSALFGKLPVEVIDTPRRDLPRPTTETTVLELINWLQAHPEIKNITFVSNQPHAEYQNIIVTMVFEREGVEIPFEVIGPEFLLSQTADQSTQIKSLVGALGTQIYAKTPAIVAKLKLNTNNQELNALFAKLYEKQPLIYKSVQSLFKMA